MMQNKNQTQSEEDDANFNRHFRNPQREAPGARSFCLRTQLGDEAHAAGMKLSSIGGIAMKNHPAIWVPPFNGTSKWRMQNLSLQCPMVLDSSLTCKILQVFKEHESCS